MLTNTASSSRTGALVRALIPATAAAALLLGAASPAAAGNPCTSEWIKFKTFFDKNGPKIAKGICQLFNKDDAAAAQKCVQDYEQAKAKVDATIHKYNGMAGDSQWKVGPRGLGEGQWASGTLLYERTFAGPPVMSDSYRLDFERTGGKAKKAMRGTVCFLDENGQLAGSTASFSIDPGNTRYGNTFQGVAGLTPVILLEKPPGTNGHQYRIKGQSGGEPAIVKQAREVKGGGACSNPCPNGGSFDGANCYMGSPPAGTKAFIYGGSYYYTPVGANSCPKSGSRFDGANCHVQRVPSGVKPFIYANNWYYQNVCK
ncbi:MAG: hypothetical protein R3A79_15170 [Nannocystaceae bacterium]